MALEIEGNVVKIMSEVQGEGRNGTWKKQEFVVETIGEYPKQICFETWGDRTDIVKSLQQNDRVKVSFELSSREYNEKWYTGVRAWKVVKILTEQLTGGTNNPETQQNSENNNVSNVEEPPLPENKEEDDLPF